MDSVLGFEPRLMSNCVALWNHRPCTVANSLIFPRVGLINLRSGHQSPSTARVSLFDIQSTVLGEYMKYSLRARFAPTLSRHLGVSVHHHDMIYIGVIFFSATLIT